MTKEINVKFLGCDCRVEVGSYNNGRMALGLVDRSTNEPFTTATVNLPFDPLGKNEVFIKDYSENEGLLKAMEEAGVVKATGEKVQSGFAQVVKATVIHPQLVREEYAQCQEKTHSRDGQQRGRGR